MAPQIFKDSALQADFERKGFVVVDFLEESDVSFLDRRFDELHPVIPEGVGFISGSYSNDIAYKQTASNTITAVFNRHFDRHFTDWQTFGGAFLYKAPSGKSELGVHQDWTIVDEDRFVALNCWVPLLDINETNGALHVLPGSQYDKYHTLRAPTLPFFFSGMEDQVIEAAIPCYPRAGQAVILNQSVIHYSPSNRSDKMRKAITAGVKTKGAPMIFHYKNEEGNVMRFAMPEDFLISFKDFATSIFERPIGELISEDAYSDPVLKQEDVLSLLSRLKKDAGYEPKRQSFFRNLLSKFQK